MKNIDSDIGSGSDIDSEVPVQEISGLELRIIQVFTPIDALICTIKNFKRRSDISLTDYIRLQYDAQKRIQEITKIERYRRLLELNREHGRKVPFRKLKTYLKTACGVAMYVSMLYRNRISAYDA